MAIVKGEVEPEEEAIGDDKDEDENQVRTIVNNDEESEKEEDEDEELAMARAIESEQTASAMSDGETAEPEDKQAQFTLTKDLLSQGEGKKDVKANKTNKTKQADVKSDESDEEDVVHDFAEAQTQQTLKEGEKENELIHDTTQQDSLQTEDNGKREEQHETKETIDSKYEGYVHDDRQGTNENSRLDGEAATEITEKDSQPKNARWKAMLEKEKQILKRQKALRKGQIDDEAEEEEEDEGVAGLEDFGFALKSDKKQDEENDDEADEEDFENIVDEVSDGEGDEEAGDEARKELQIREEKMRHKEVLRRIREGYDGKRGGVAGGSSKRGNLRFDQLVAADNKDSAKRLGLLNDDELDSEDEEANVSGEVEDEEVLIDKMLKDRYLNRPELPEEIFSDSEVESDVENEGNGK